MVNAIKNLLIALINATLILLALCLFLGWKLTQSVENVQARFAENLQFVEPLKDQTQGIRAELSAMRDDLAAIRAQDASTLDPTTSAKLSSTLQRLNALEGKLENVQAGITGALQDPEALINSAISSAADAVSDQIVIIRGCEPAT